MLMRTGEPVFLVPGVDTGLDLACAAVELDSGVGVAASEPVFEVAGLDVGPPVELGSAWAPAVPVLRVSESEPVCALAGKASITAKKGTITKPRKCLGEANRCMS